MALRSYVKIYNFGHKAIEDLFKDPVIIQEKVDGSQFSFGVDKDTGELLCASHYTNLNLNAAGMFQPAVDYVKSIAGKLFTGCAYRGEFLAKPHHNTLKYNRIPNNHIILFDIDMGQENYLPPDGVRREADFLGLEVVPTYPTEGVKLDVDNFNEFLKKESILGGTTIEGVVIKNYHRFGVDGHCLMGKFVSEKFKEMNKKQFKQTNPSQGDIVQQLSTELKTDARWLKAIQHLKEQGLLKDDPADIGILLKELNKDIDSECADYIKERLYSHSRKEILRGATKGFPAWYKQLLVEKQFNKEN